MTTHWMDKISLRTKATGTVVLVIVSALVTVTVAGILQMHALLAQEEQRSVQAVARGIGRASELALAVRDERELTQIATRFMRDDQILIIAIYDAGGKLIAKSSRTPQLWEHYLQGSTAHDNLLLGEQAIELIRDGDQFNPDGIDPQPLNQPSRQTTLQPGQIGRVVVGLSTAPSLQAQQKQTGLTILSTLLAALASMGLVYAAVGTWTRRLHRLVLASERIAQGDLSQPLNEDRRDEIGRLSDAYEQMRQAVQLRDAEVRRFNETLQLQVEQRTRSLSEALEAAQAADRAKSRFLATMSHEIRTPLNGIVGMVDLLRGTQLDETQIRYTHIARSSADALLAVINDILDFSKIEAGRMELEAIDFDLAATLEDLTETAAQAAARKGVELACLLHPDVPNRAIGDGGRLRQIVTNLINNAIKFTDHGQIVLRAAMVQHDSTGMLLRFSVEDTGIGIPEDRRSRLFHSFSQVDSSTTRKYGGTGLGLAICKRLAELMGGSIGVDSQPGAGSTFWFTARLQAAPTSDKTPDKTRPQFLGDLRQLRILAVDDSAVSREILTQQLAAWNLHVSTAPDGTTALAMLDQAARDGQPFQLAILDRHMPLMDGIQLGAAIHTRPDHRHLPLIMLTNMEDHIRAAELNAMGFAAYLVKPVRQSRLFDVIAETISTAWHQGSAAPVPPTPALTPPSADHHRTLRVLLAEDNEINQMVASEMLTNAGFTCDIVDNGRRACEATAAQNYDVVLMDCQMPEMDGFEAARRIRQREAGTHTHLPIVALTANAIKGDREDCLAAGMDGYVTKPINPENLIEAIHAALNQSCTNAI